ncbi:MAG TPA: LLM class flavin-dependent oxidoreductase, partial [Candidatus Dormibacteraeota bacterium]|nr:LLM class flavin-dependent oxidoreductase [Candidatus Dormibacteraeota bacterium]
MLAKAAASIDILCCGRFELGLGAGGFWDAIEAYGGPRRSPGESVEALDVLVELATEHGMD